MRSFIQHIRPDGSGGAGRNTNGSNTMTDSQAGGAAPAPHPEPDDTISELPPRLARVPYLLNQTTAVIGDDVQGKRPGASTLTPVPTAVMAVAFGVLAPLSLITHAAESVQILSISGLAAFGYLAMVSISAWWRRHTLERSRS